MSQLSLGQSVTALGASATFTGGWVPREKFGRAVALAYASHAGTMYIDESVDGSNTIRTTTQSVSATTATSKDITVIAPFVRIRYANGGTAQTAFYFCGDLREEKPTATVMSDMDGTELILDADADTSITADTDNQIDVKIGGTDRIVLKGAATVNLFDIVSAVTTTGKVVDLSDADGLTTGKIIDATSNSSDTGTRSLVYAKNDHASATGATVAELVQDSTGNTLTIDHNGATGKAIFIDHEGTTQTAGIIDISPAVLTTGTVIDIGDADALTTGKILNLVSNSADTGTRVLVQITNDNTAATGATCLTLQNDATAGAAMKITGTGILGIDFTGLDGTNDAIFDCTAGTGCTAAPQTNAAIGFIRIRVGGTDQWIPYYNAT